MWQVYVSHISCSRQYFHNLRAVIGMSVSLPNTSRVSVEFMGDICFNQHITFYNVLYIPSFAFNLISISAMTGQLLIEIRFDRDFCAF